MVLDAALLSTQHYKVRNKGKVEQSREWSSALHLGVVAIEKGAFGSPSTKVANLLNSLNLEKRYTSRPSYVGKANYKTKYKNKGGVGGWLVLDIYPTTPLDQDAT